MKEIIINVETNEVVEQDMAPELVAEIEANVAKQAELDSLQQAKQSESAAARAALLAKLGITEEEAKLLLGGN